MERFFCSLSQSRSATHLTALVASCAVLIAMFSWGGASFFKLGMALSIWCLIYGVLSAVAAAYADSDTSPFTVKDIFIGMALAISSFLVLCGAGIYAWLNR